MDHDEHTPSKDVRDAAPHRPQRSHSTAVGSARRWLAALGVVACLGGGGLAAAPAAGAVPISSDQEASEDLTTALSLTNDYWASHYAEAGLTTYTPPRLWGSRGDGMYDSAASSVRGTCGGSPIQVWERNAFYCNEGPGGLIGFDWQRLSTSHQYGDGMIYFLVAHEWGHSIDVQRNGRFSSRYEAVADCYAGAAMAGAQRDGTLLLDDEDLREVWAFMDSTRLTPQLPYHATQNPYGTPEERWGFFAQGFQAGPTVCASAGQQSPF